MRPLAILITGGCGFIGSNLAARLARDGHRVTVSDRFGTGAKWRNLAGVEVADVVLPDRLDEHLAHAPADVVLHMGAVSSTTESDVDLILRTNLEWSQRLLERCARDGTRFVYASSAATYGDGALGFDDDGSSAALARLRPLNPYGWSKHLFDQAVARRRREGRPLPRQCVGLKFFNVFGPNEAHKGDMRSVAAKIFDQIRRGEPVTLFRSHRPDCPDGGQRRDFVCVDDVVEVVAWLVERPDVSGLFNVGTGEARSFADLAGAVFAALNRAPRIAYIDMPEPLRAQYQSFTEAPMARLRQAGYARPFTPLEDGVARYVDRLRRGPA